MVGCFLENLGIHKLMSPYESWINKKLCTALQEIKPRGYMMSVTGPAFPICFKKDKPLLSHSMLPLSETQGLSSSLATASGPEAGFWPKQHLFKQLLSLRSKKDQLGQSGSLSHNTELRNISLDSLGDRTFEGALRFRSGLEQAPSKCGLWSAGLAGCREDTCQGSERPWGRCGWVSGLGATWFLMPPFPSCWLWLPSQLGGSLWSYYYCILMRLSASPYMHPGSEVAHWVSIYNNQKITKLKVIVSVTQNTVNTMWLILRGNMCSLVERSLR